MDIDLPVHERVLDVFEIELVSKGVAISLEPAFDFITFCFGQEFGTMIESRQSCILEMGLNKEATHVRG